MVSSKSRKDADLKDKSTTIRVNESTKKMLSDVARGQESFNDTIARLISVFKNLQVEEPNIISKGNVVGTEYSRIRRNYSITIGSESFDVACVFNDLRAFSSMHLNRFLYTAFSQSIKGSTQWEIDLQILDVRTKRYINEHYPLEHEHKYEYFAHKDQNKMAIIYFVTVKKILEEIFFVNLYEFVTNNDYLTWDNWNRAYTRNNLSEESFRKDIEKKLNDLKFSSFSWIEH